MDNNFYKTYCTAYCDFDKNMNIKLSSVLNYLHDAGGNHAHLLNAGSAHLEKKSMFFALTKIKCEFFGVISPNQNITVTTTTKPLGKMSLGRDYIISSDEKVLIKSSSKWAVVDLNLRRALKISALENKAFEMSAAFDTGVELEPIIMPQIPMSKSYTYYPSFCDLDFNNHINNAKYADAITNAVAAQLGKNRIKSAQINYLIEGKDGDIIDFYTQQLGNEILVSGICGEERRIISKIVL